MPPEHEEDILSSKNDADNLDVGKSDPPSGSEQDTDKPPVSQEDAGEPESLMDAILKTNPELEVGDEEDILAEKSDDPDGAAKADTDKQDNDQSDKPKAEDKDGKPAAEEGKDDGEDDGDADDGNLEISSKEFQRMNSKTRRKVRALQDTARQADALREPAQAAENLNKYLRDNNINNQDFDVLLGLGAALQRGDFKTFLEGVSPFVQIAQEYVGQALPKELRDQVLTGEMSEEAAKKLARERMDGEIERTRLQREAETTRQRQEEQALETRNTLAQQVGMAVSNWENTVKASDPDYAAKARAVRQYSRSLIEERGRDKPLSPEEAVAIAKEAYRQVNEDLKQWQPKPKPTSRVPDGSQRSTSGQSAEPQSLFEAGMAGLRNAQ